MLLVLEPFQPAPPKLLSFLPLFHMSKFRHCVCERERERKGSRDGRRPVNYAITNLTITCKETCASCMKLSQRRSSNRPRILCFLRFSLRVLHQAQHQRQQQASTEKVEMPFGSLPERPNDFPPLMSTSLARSKTMFVQTTENTLAGLNETASEKLHPVHCAVRRFDVEIRRIGKCDTQTQRRKPVKSWVLLRAEKEGIVGHLSTCLVPGR